MNISAGSSRRWLLQYRFLNKYPHYIEVHLWYVIPFYSYIRKMGSSERQLSRSLRYAPEFWNDMLSSETQAPLTRKAGPGCGLDVIFSTSSSSHEFLTKAKWSRTVDSSAVPPDIEQRHNPGSSETKNQLSPSLVLFICTLQLADWALFDFETFPEKFGKGTSSKPRITTQQQLNSAFLMEHNHSIPTLGLMNVHVGNAARFVRHVYTRFTPKPTNASPGALRHLEEVICRSGLLT